MARIPGKCVACRNSVQATAGRAAEKLQPPHGVKSHLNCFLATDHLRFPCARAMKIRRRSVIIALAAIESLQTSPLDPQLTSIIFAPKHLQLFVAQTDTARPKL